MKDYTMRAYERMKAHGHVRREDRKWLQAGLTIGAIIILYAAVYALKHGN